MSSDKYEKLGPKLAEFGNEVARIVGDDLNGVFVYVEAGEGWVGTSIFKEQADHVDYVEEPDDSRVTDLVIAAREAESDDPDRRWVAMTYEIVDGKFNATFKFADEVDVEVDTYDRHVALLKERYGDKAIVYPPWPDGAFELEPTTK